MYYGSATVLAHVATLHNIYYCHLTVEGLSYVSASLCPMSSLPTSIERSQKRWACPLRDFTSTKRYLLSG